MKRGFTLIELATVVCVISLLMLLLVPGVQRLRDVAARGTCANNLKMLVTANALYAADHGHYVAAAEDIHGANLTRWHGRRSSVSEPFDGAEGPLSPYYGHSRTIRGCPAFRPASPGPGVNAFEASCGGYGYNDRGVGSRTYFHGHSAEAAQRGISAAQLSTPSLTVMFADTAFPQPYGNPEYLIEYSFAEAYHFVMQDGDGRVSEVGTAMPSIHFRHGGRANVAWSDGHVSSEKLETEYNRAFTDMDIGWPGGPNNDLFRPF